MHQHAGHPGQHRRADQLGRELGQRGQGTLQRPGQEGIPAVMGA